MDKVLFIVRHGEAEPRAKTDFDRQLTASGQTSVQALGDRLSQRLNFLKEKYLKETHSSRAMSAVVIASPYVRAQQTASILAQTTSLKVQTFDQVTPDDNAEQALLELHEIIPSECDCVVLVSHMPFVGSLLGQITANSDWAGRGFMTAECIELACSEFLPGCGSEVGVV